jgi:undecaprenyl pyrophosphate phosphatase UppP
MQEIIVYRNPLEAALWGSLGNGELFPIMVAMLVAFVTVLICIRIAESYAPRQKMKLWSNLSLVAGAVAAVIVLWVM